MDTLGERLFFLLFHNFQSQIFSMQYIRNNATLSTVFNLFIESMELLFKGTPLWFITIIIINFILTCVYLSPLLFLSHTSSTISTSQYLIFSPVNVGIVSLLFQSCVLSFPVQYKSSSNVQWWGTHSPTIHTTCALHWQAVSVPLATMWTRIQCRMGAFQRLVEPLLNVRDPIPKRNTQNSYIFCNFIQFFENIFHLLYQFWYGPALTCLLQFISLVWKKRTFYFIWFTVFNGTVSSVKNKLKCYKFICFYRNMPHLQNSMSGVVMFN